VYDELRFVSIFGVLYLALHVKALLGMRGPWAAFFDEAFHRSCIWDGVRAINSEFLQCRKCITFSPLQVIYTPSFPSSI